MKPNPMPLPALLEDPRRLEITREQVEDLYDKQRLLFTLFLGCQILVDGVEHTLFRLDLNDRRYPELILGRERAEISVAAPPYVPVKFVSGDRVFQFIKRT